MKKYRLPLIQEAPIPSDVALPQPIAYYYLAADVDAREAQSVAVIKAQRERIAQLEKAVRDCIASIEGYRRETNDPQQCDAERAAGKLVKEASA